MASTSFNNSESDEGDYPGVADEILNHSLAPIIRSNHGTNYYNNDDNFRSYISQPPAPISLNRSPIVDDTNYYNNDDNFPRVNPQLAIGSISLDDDTNYYNNDDNFPRYNPRSIRSINPAVDTNNYNNGDNVPRYNPQSIRLINPAVDTNNYNNGNNVPRYNLQSIRSINPQLAIGSISLDDDTNYYNNDDNFPRYNPRSIRSINPAVDTNNYNNGDNVPRYNPRSIRSINPVVDTNNYNNGDNFPRYNPRSIRLINPAIVTNNYNNGDNVLRYNPQSIRLINPAIDTNNYNNNDNVPRYNLQSIRSINPGAVDTNYYNNDGNFLRYDGNTVDYTNYSLNHLSSSDIREMAEIAKTESGSEIMQHYLMKTNSVSCKETIFRIFFEHMFDLLFNQFANHTFSRLVERCDDQELRLIINKLTMDSDFFVFVLKERFGANSVKRLINMLKKSPLVNKLTKIIVRNLKTLMNTRISSHVVTKCLECLDIHQNKELFEAIISNCIELATNDRGCVALNESIEYFKEPYRSRLLKVISDQAIYLTPHRTGNYVVKKVLSLSNPQVTKTICQRLSDNFATFSTQKSSSNVVEECLSSKIGVNLVLRDFLKYDNLWIIASDQYGNYVIQTALRKAGESELYNEFVYKLHKGREHFETGYGRKVYEMIMNITSNHRSGLGERYVRR